MTIQRQSIKSGIASGNFGRAGTPLPSVRQNSGPDLSRLAQSLGVGIKSVVGEIQREDTAAAKAAVQEAIQKTQHSTPEERAQVLKTIRSQFDDQNLFMKIFTDENPAVKVMDEVTGMSKALETRNALLAASEKNKHLRLADQQEIQRKILEEASMFSKGISEGTHRAYLNSIHNSALQIDDQTTAAWAKRNESEDVAKITDTYYKEGTDLLSGMLQVTPEAMATDLESFKAGREAFNNNLVGIKVNVAKRAQDVFNKIMSRTEGNKQAAGAASVDYVTALAEQYAAPELLDILNDKSVRGKGRQALGTFYNKQIQAAKTGIQSGIVRREQQLAKKQKAMFDAQNQAQYTEIISSVDSAVSSSIANPGDPLLVNIARDEINQQLTKFNKDKAAGLYDNNIDQALRINKALISYEKSMNQANGDVRAESIVINALADGSMNQDLYNTYADRLGPDMKRHAFSFIQPQIEEAQANREALRQAKADKRKRAIARPGVDLMQTIEAFENTFINSKVVDSLKVGDTKDEFPEIDKAQFNAEYKEAITNATTLSLEEHDKIPTVQELHEAVKPVVDKWQKLYDKRKSMIEQHIAPVQKKLEEQREAKAAKTAKEHPELSIFLDTPLFSRYEATNEQIDSAFKAVSEGKADVFGNTRKDQIMHDGVTTKIFNNNSTVADALTIASKHLVFDIKDKTQRSLLAETISKGLHDQDRYAGLLISPWQNSTDRLIREPLEAIGVADTFADDIRTAIIDGSLFTDRGLRNLQKVYPNKKKTWGNIEGVIKKLKGN